jgi:hypothetical protein
MMKPTWKPAWEVDGRTPAFINESDKPSPMLVMHGKEKYLWGNVPAIDLINNGNNEGLGLPAKLRLLFAGTYLSQKNFIPS